MTEYLYLIRCREEAFKIGIASDVRSRIASLQTGNPYKLELAKCYSFSNAEVIERALHMKFEPVRMVGEWFRLTDEQLYQFVKICGMFDGKLVDVDNHVTEDEIQEAEEIQETEDILTGGVSWRLERRNDRTPPGYAILQRGRGKKYLGYVGMRNLKDPNRPTVEEIEAVIEKHARSEEMELLFDTEGVDHE
jgi:hypothetical protein